MAKGIDYVLSGVKYAVFSYEGAVVTVRGECEVEYVSDEAPTMPIYLNTHFALEGARQQAADRQEQPPRVLVVGSSRHTLARILCNYAVRGDKTPVVVELDCSRGALLFPGTLTAQVVDRVAGIEEGFPEAGRISYFYGHQAPAGNPKMYVKLMKRLAFAVSSRLAAMDDQQQKAGAIIVAPAEAGEYLGDIKELFQVSMILVIGNERLHSTIAKTAPGLTVLKVPLSGGFVPLDAGHRRMATQQLFKSYFYGPRAEYTPFTLVLAWDKVHLRRLGEEALAPSSALPLGATRKVSETRTSKVEPSKGLLLYSILACSYAASEEGETLSDANCAGYVYVTAVDEAKKQMTVLSPCPGRLPGPYLIVGGLKWIEK